MDYELSDAHKLIRDTARRIAREKVAPRSAELDESGEYPHDLFQVFADAGLLGPQGGTLLVDLPGGTPHLLCSAEVTGELAKTIQYARTSHPDSPVRSGARAAAQRAAGTRGRTAVGSSSLYAISARRVNALRRKSAPLRPGAVRYSDRSYSRSGGCSVVS